MRVEAGSSLRAAGADPRQADREIREAAREFEAMLLARVFESLSASFSGSEDEAVEGGLLNGFLWMEMARQLSSGREIGLAELVYRQVQPQPPETAPPAAATPSPEASPPPRREVEPAAAPGPDARREPAEVALRRPVEGYLTSPFGLRRDPLDGARRAHRGIDLAATEGTPVHASASGRVRASGVQGGYGTTVLVEHEGGITTRYAHLRRTLIKEGDWVEKGQVIGEVGRTGRATGPHLHYEVRRDGEAQDPEDWL